MRCPASRCSRCRVRRSRCPRRSPAVERRNGTFPAQLFASNAVRQLRASVGEPAAVISSHRAAGAPGGGELRLSLSSPFELRDAQGFRCPVYPGERVVDVATMLVELLHDCRVTDIRAVAGVHADRDALTGGPLLFKPETIPPSFPVTIH